MNPMLYNANHSIVFRFYQHARFGLSHDIPRYGQDKNWVEKIGDLGLWTIENFPGKVWNLMKEPRWITIALTQISLASVTYLFYPKITFDAVKLVAGKIPMPSREQVKFAVYLTLIAHIVSAAFRAYGRFRNEELMDSWYKNAPTPAAVANPARNATPVVVINDVLDDKEVEKNAAASDIVETK